MQCGGGICQWVVGFRYCCFFLLLFFVRVATEVADKNKGHNFQYS